MDPRLQTYEYLGLDLIMNHNKRAKKTDTESAQAASLNRLHKAFQILQQRIANSPIASRRLDAFAEYLESRSKEIVVAFEQENMGKDD